MIKKFLHNYWILKQYTTYDRQPFFQLVKPFAQNKKVIVDIGPGTDAFAKTIGRNDVHLLEGNEQTFLNLKRTFPNTHRYHAPDPLLFQDRSVNLVHLSHILEHLTPNECYKLLVEVDRVLALEGIIAISTPTSHPDFYNDLSHQKPYNPGVFLKYLVWGDATSTTRPIISNRYTQMLLVYRYAFHALPIVGSKYAILDGIGYLLQSVLRRLHLGIYQKTGYTLILKKQ